MSRISKQCPGDCSKCDLLISGEVDMVPCVLDQIFQHVRRQDKEISELKESVRNAERKVELTLAATPDLNMEDKGNELHE